MNLVDRAKNILLQPRSEWHAIDAEPHTVQDLYTSYVMVLAAIPAVFGFLGGISMGMPLESGVAQLALHYLLALGTVYLFAIIINELAPSFGSRKDFMQALKVAAFAPTAAWLGGVFNVHPALAILGLAASLYSLYLLYLGLPVLMKTPEDKTVPYGAVVIIAMIVIVVIVGTIVALVAPNALRGF
jgi:hypothetical protein